MPEPATSAETTAPRRPNSLNGERTREKILDAAEALFASQAYDSVSLRDITRQAGVTLALASYHFGAKEALFEAVVARRAEALGAMRRERLAALARPDTAPILDAFMAPLFEKMAGGEPGWSDYLSVLARLGAEARWGDLVSRHFDAVARAFLDALRQALPDADPHELARAFTFVLEAMLQAVSRRGRLDRLSQGAARADDLDRAYPTLLAFATAGLERVGRPVPAKGNRP